MNQTMPATLNDAIAMEPAWLQAWIMLLVISHALAIVFVVGRERGRWRVRYEPIAIIVSFLLAGVFMNWLYQQVGYVRLLGLAHLTFWTPVYLWVLSRRRAIAADRWFGRYVLLYLAVAGASLLIDLLDVIRYLVGDGALL